MHATLQQQQQHEHKKGSHLLEMNCLNAFWYLKETEANMLFVPASVVKSPGIPFKTRGTDSPLLCSLLIFIKVYLISTNYSLPRSPWRIMAALLPAPDRNLNCCPSFLLPRWHQSGSVVFQRHWCWSSYLSVNQSRLAESSSSMCVRE